MQEIFNFLTDFVSRPDEILMQFISNYGNWIYLALFLIIFAETGLIIFSFLMPFLPGDALIFAVGMIAANDSQNHLHIAYIIPLLMVAALLGDNLNYYVGKRFGSWVMSQKAGFFVKPVHIKKASYFLEQHGQKSIIIARFMPVIRTIMPFVCGTTGMNYRTFLKFSFIGAVLWVGVISVLGYFFGQFHFVQENLEYFIFGIIIAANTPLLIRLIKSRFSKKNKK